MPHSSAETADLSPSLAANRHDIPSLDGLRALSIGIVILSHTKSLLPAAVANSGLFRYGIGGGLHGVQVFFVISGYLITTLFIREYDRTGVISLKRFYARRSLRIFPPFYVYLALLGVLWLVRVIPEDAPSFFAAATYTIVYLPNPRGWFVLHAWSLSIEEQFYVLWPLALLLAHRRGKSVQLTFFVLAAMPLVRATLFFAAGLRSGTPPHAIVMSSSIDTLMTGCLLALVSRQTWWSSFHRRFIRAWTAAGMLVLGFVAVPYLSAKLTRGVGAMSIAAFGATITALSIGVILVYVVENSDSFWGQVLNLRLVRHLGVISYSLYLWQQFFTAEDRPAKLYSYLFMLLAAELSFWLVERPIMRLRAPFDWRLQSRLN